MSYKNYNISKADAFFKKKCLENLLEQKSGIYYQTQII